MTFLPDGRIGEGGAACERWWNVGRILNDEFSILNEAAGVHPNSKSNIHHSKFSLTVAGEQGVTFRVAKNGDENIYPAYHEDQEIALRAALLGVPRAILREANGRISHGGSETRKNASEAVQEFIRKAKGMSGEYIERRWGALPAPGMELPDKRFPFDNAALHPADWTLEFEVRAAVARLCEEVTGFPCPMVYHRAEGGLCF